MPEPGSPLPQPDDDAALAALLAEALAGDPAAEEARALAEICDDLAALGDAPLAPLGPDVRAAALAAWTSAGSHAAATAVEPARFQVAPRPSRATRPDPVHLLRWAALLLVGLGVTLFAVLSAPDEAAAGIRLGTLFRLDQTGGRQEAMSGRRIPWGERIAAGPNEVLGFRLPDGSAVALLDGGVVRLAGAADGGAVLALESGTARAAVADGGEVRLAHGPCRFHLLQGRAALSAADGLLLLGPTARGRLELPGAAVRLLEGPLQGRCTSADGFREQAGRPAPGSFHMPSALDARHLGRAPGRLVAARQWRVVGGEGRRRGTSILVGAAGVRLAWRPAPEVRRAGTLRLRIEGGEGLVVTLAGGDAGAVPGARRADLALPADWYAGVVARGGELVLDLRWQKEGGQGARFLGASFLSDLSDDDSESAEAAAGAPRRE